LEAIEVASQFLKALPQVTKAPEAVASADGTVGWFWNTRGVYIDVTFFPDGHFAYYGEAKGGARVAKATLKRFNAAIPQDLLDIIDTA
jgi:hypothetical protein